MKHLLIFALLLPASMLFAQRYVGAVVSPGTLFGREFTWNDAREAYAGVPMLDTLNLTNGFHAQGSSEMFLITSGIQLRIKPQDTAAWLYNWSRTFTFQYGTLNHSMIWASREQLYDVNMPYTTIFQGDTTTYLLDSIQSETYGISSFSRCLNMSFALMHEHPSSRRALWDAGLRAGLVIGLTDRSMMHTVQTNYRDSIGGFYAPESYVLNTQFVDLGRSATIVGSVDVIAGCMTPFTRSSKWWLNMHLGAGIGVLSDFGTIRTRANLVFNFGVSYRLSE